jgi:hypothetical protein
LSGDGRRGGQRIRRSGRSHGGRSRRCRSHRAGSHDGLERGARRADSLRFLDGRQRLVRRWRAGRRGSWRNLAWRSTCFKVGHPGLLCRHSLYRRGGWCSSRLGIRGGGWHAGASEQSSGTGWRRTRGRRKNGGGRGGHAARGIGRRCRSLNRAGARNLRSRRRPRWAARRNEFARPLRVLGIRQCRLHDRRIAGAPIDRVVDRRHRLHADGLPTRGCIWQRRARLSASRQRKAKHPYCDFSSHD